MRRFLVFFDRIMCRDPGVVEGRPQGGYGLLWPFGKSQEQSGSHDLEHRAPSGRVYPCVSTRGWGPAPPQPGQIRDYLNRIDCEALQFRRAHEVRVSPTQRGGVVRVWVEDPMDFARLRIRVKGDSIGEYGHTQIFSDLPCGYLACWTWHARNMLKDMRIEHDYRQLSSRRIRLTFFLFSHFAAFNIAVGRGMFDDILRRENPDVLPPGGVQQRVCQNTSSLMYCPP